MKTFSAFMCSKKLEEVISVFDQEYHYELLENSETEEFVERIIRSSNFLEWLNKEFGISGKISLLAKNAGRMAYSIGDDYVAKFTNDRKEADAAAVVKKNPSEFAAKVYYSGQIRQFSSKNTGIKQFLYLIIMDRLNTNTGKKYKIAGNSIYKFMDFETDSMTKMSPEQAYQRIVDRYLDPKYRKDMNVLHAIRTMIHSVKGLYDQSGVLTQDTHGGNVAFSKDRKPAFFDFGRSRLDLDSNKLDGVRVGNLEFA